MPMPHYTLSGLPPTSANLAPLAICAGLFLCRAAVGLGEGVAPSAATDMVARVVSTEERSRAISFIFGGLHVGSLLGLLVAPALIEQFGWQTIFYLFGIAGPPHPPSVAVCLERLLS